MKYSFSETDGVAWLDYTVPRINISEKKYKKLEIICSLSWEYVKKIVSKMDDVKNGELDIYGFWPEDSVYIEAAWPTFHREEFRNKCYITKAFDREFSMTVEFDEIYNLMKDFLVEIEKWEKKTWKEKPGW